MSIGEKDPNGYIIYEPKDLSLEYEWMQETKFKLKLSNPELQILWEIMDRGATRNQALKTMEQLRAKEVEKTEAFNSLLVKEEDRNSYSMLYNYVIGLKL